MTLDVPRWSIDQDDGSFPPIADISVLPQLVCTRRFKKLAPLRQVPRGDLKSICWQHAIALRDSLLKFCKRYVEDV
jgi:hypothetical protein